jgi:hypothetical protein
LFANFLKILLSVSERADFEMLKSLANSLNEILLGMLKYPFS